MRDENQPDFFISTYDLKRQTSVYFWGGYSLGFLIGITSVIAFITGYLWLTGAL